MPSTVKYNPELEIVEAKYVGHVTGDEYKKDATVAFDLAKTNNTNLFLIDDSELMDAGSVLDLYDLPALYEELGFKRSSKAALVLPIKSAAAAEDVRFYETVCINRGWQVQVFTERQEAVEWLRQTKPSNKPDAGDGK